MKINISLDEVKRIAAEGDYDIVPICSELLSDIKTPVQVLRSLMNVSEHCYMLESVEDNERWGRYSFLGFEPKFIITCSNGRMRVGDEEFQTFDPDKHIREVLSRYKSPVIQGMPTFTGGLVGYFSYDYLKYSEPTLRLDAKDTEGFKDVDLMLFDKVIAFDNLKSRIILIANVPTADIENGYVQAVAELERMEELIRHGEPVKDTGGHMTSGIKPLFSKEELIGIVCKITLPGPLTTVLKTPSPPTSIFFTPFTVTTSIVQVSSIAAKYPVLIRISCPASNSYSTACPSISTNAVPFPLSFCIMKPSPPNIPFP